MKKSIYSLVLADDVIAAADRLAYEKGTSRSNLINQILAERLSLMTPEMRFQDIFQAMEQILDQSMQVMNRSSGTMLQVRSPLKFKYNPTIRYQLELYRENGISIGSLRISFRTTSRDLLRLLDSFFDLWMELEHEWIVPVLGHPIRYLKEDGKLVRELYYPANLPAVSGEDAGNAIGDYICLLDSCIKQFFLLAGEPGSLQRASVEHLFTNTLNSGTMLII